METKTYTNKAIASRNESIQAMREEMDNVNYNNDFGLHTPEFAEEYHHMKIRQALPALVNTAYNTWDEENTLVNLKGRTCINENFGSYKEDAIFYAYEIKAREVLATFTDKDSCHGYLANLKSKIEKKDKPETWNPVYMLIAEEKNNELKSLLYV